MEPTPIGETATTNFRLGHEHRTKLDQIAAEKGWDLVQVVRAALDDYHRRTFGRRSADMVPVRKRQEKPK
jgi:hypothetical protein